MLYVTTRNNRDAFTPSRVQRENRGADGGLYIPFRGPNFSAEEIAGLRDKSFGQCVADVLNALFSAELTNWDIDFCAGRYPVRTVSLGHRILMGETWHNPEWNFDRMVNSLSSFLCKEEGVTGNWMRIAVRAAVLFGIFGQLQRMGVERFDLSVVSGDFSAPMSAWYARRWGLPIGNIVCCCNENNTIWDLFSHGHLRTDGLSTPTLTPEADVSLPSDLERLICECGGVEEVERYLTASRCGSMYCPGDAIYAKLREGMFVSVVSTQRMESTIPSVYATHQYLLSPYGALAYAGLQDYRAKTGVTRHAVVLTEKSPVCDAETVAKAMGITEEAVKRYI